MSVAVLAFKNGRKIVHFGELIFYKVYTGKKGSLNDLCGAVFMKRLRVFNFINDTMTSMQTISRIIAFHYAYCPLTKSL